MIPVADVVREVILPYIFLRQKNYVQVRNGKSVSVQSLLLCRTSTTPLVDKMSLKSVHSVPLWRYVYPFLERGGHGQVPEALPWWHFGVPYTRCRSTNHDLLAATWDIAHVTPSRKKALAVAQWVCFASKSTPRRCITSLVAKASCMHWRHKVVLLSFPSNVQVPFLWFPVRTGMADRAFLNMLSEIAPKPRCWGTVSLCVNSHASFQIRQSRCRTMIWQCA